MTADRHLELPGGGDDAITTSTRKALLKSAGDTHNL
jgi:hypothetical protein